MSIIAQIKEKAKADKKYILLPEGTEERTVQAAEIITKQGIAKVALLGNESEIKDVAAKFNVDLSGVDIIDPVKSADFEGYVEKFYEMRKAKGVTPEQADKMMHDTLFFAAMMIKEGKADGMVAGAINTTGNTLRPGLQIIKMAKGISVVSSCFIMELPNKSYGDDGILALWRPDKEGCSPQRCADSRVSHKGRQHKIRRHGMQTACLTEYPVP